MEQKIHFYCINLKNRTDRWNTFSSQLAIEKIKAKHNFERFEAVSGSTVDVQNDSRISLRTKRNIKESARREHSDINTAGAIGCYLSHTDLWRKVADGSEPFAVIFEDDTELPDDFLEIFESCFQDKNLLPDMPDIWTFSYGWWFYYDAKGVKYPQNVPENIRGPWVLNTCPGGLNGYFITKEGAKKLLDMAFPIDMHVDMYICMCAELHRIKCVAHKRLILSLLSESEKSDIQLQAECAICDLPSDFKEQGIITLNMRILFAAVICLYFLERITRSGRR
jgi:GR25 family glycosyltransferase involved in LPS biosynthesis